MQQSQEVIRTQADIELVLEFLNCAAVVTGEQGEVLAANAAAKRSLVGAGPLRIRDGLLQCTRVRDDQEMRARIAACRSGRGAHGGAPHYIRLESGSRTLTVFIAPWPLAPARHALVTCFDSAQQDVACDPHSLQLCLGLTASEAEVAAAIGSGLTVAEIAQQQSISISTVRTHVQRVLQKAGLTRQVQLIRLMCALPPRPWNARGVSEPGAAD